jgi:hypothetical protein
MQFEEMEYYPDSFTQEPDAYLNAIQWSPDRALWQSVIVQAVKEAIGRGSYRLTSAKAQAARHWILEDTSGDFERVCDLADMEAGYIRRKVRDCYNNATRVTL